ncbi:hypothetical protein [Pantoea endophytica]|uniref:hypothetical protein n=1 Tax=Pantoea endophytica TaxID=92488 RepID=UPI0028A08A2E|nr:hypothetical protein [Pantoea endophytica]
MVNLNWAHICAGQENCGRHRKTELDPAQLQQMQGNVAVRYALTYIFGSLSTIIIRVNILAKIMGRSIRQDAIKAEQGLMHGAIILAPGQMPALPELIGRVFLAGAAASRSIAQIKALANPLSRLPLNA